MALRVKSVSRLGFRGTYKRDILFGGMWCMAFYTEVKWTFGAFQARFPLFLAINFEQ